jgi:hypothetical protein
MSDEEPAAEAERTPETYYVFKPSIAGASLEFLLQADRLEVRRGDRPFAHIPYRDIRKIRLAYRPVTMQNHRFITEIWSNAGAKASFASTSPRGIVGHDSFDAHYKLFVTELHRRVSAAGGTVEYLYGSPALLYWPGVLVFLGLCAGVIILAVQAVHSVESKTWTGFAMIGAMLLYFLWQTGTFFYRNRPGDYRPDALPPQVMP